MTFELGPATSGGQWEARVRDAVRQLSTAAGQPEPSIRYRYPLLSASVGDPVRNRIRIRRVRMFLGLPDPD